MIAKLLHLSDLHFGPPLRHHLAEVVIREVYDLAPDFAVISGDLTQRARTYQFLQAHQFLQRLPSPRLIIPGNHDVPLYNLYLRFFQPLHRYRRFIEPKPDLAMLDVSGGLSAIGLNSTRSFTIDGGAIRRRQLAWAEAQFARAPRGNCRIVALHHHFLSDGSHQPPIRQARHLLHRFAAMGVEAILVGHRHWARAERAAEGPVVVQAGTAVSRRGKGRELGQNSYNVIEVSEELFRVTCHLYRTETDRFEPVWTEQFHRLGLKGVCEG